MDAGKTNQYLFRNAKNEYTESKEDKFKLVSCSANGVYCRSTLPEINRLYAEAELARINKEYQKSAEILQDAYVKTLLLKESKCGKCVDFFQTSITSTMENMQEEVYSMSVGFLSKKRYEEVYNKLCSFIQKIKVFKISSANFFTHKNTATVGADF